MADLSITVVNRLHVIAPQDPSFFGTMVWGTDYWRSDRDTDFDIGKWLSESVSFSTSEGFDIDKYIADTLTMTTTIGNQITHKIVNGLSIASSIDLGTLSQGIWNWVIKGETDLDDRVCPVWTEESDPSDSWTEDTDPTTTWTEI